MFFVFEVDRKQIMKKEVFFKCSSCLTNKFNLIEGKNIFSLFFIPIFSFYKKYFIICQNCESIYRISKKSIKKILQTGIVHDNDIEYIVFEKKTCFKCNSPINTQGNYCSNCGTKLK